MKRSQLRKNHSYRSGSSFIPRESRSCNTYKKKISILPFCHWAQFAICVFLLLIYLNNQTLFANDKNTEIDSFIQRSITCSTNLLSKEWSGSLKEIIFMEN